jgi:hypothetical protein
MIWWKTYTMGELVAIQRRHTILGDLGLVDHDLCVRLYREIVPNMLPMSQRSAGALVPDVSAEKTGPTSFVTAQTKIHDRSGNK